MQISQKFDNMIDPGAIIEQKYSDQHILIDTYVFEEAAARKVRSFYDIELMVVDSETGRALPTAMIGVDSISTTAICNDSGQIILSGIPEGRYLIDIIKPGYAAVTIDINLAEQDLLVQRSVVKMVRNC